MSDNPDKVKATQRVVEAARQQVQACNHSKDLADAVAALDALSTPPDPAVVAAEKAISNNGTNIIVLRRADGDTFELCVDPIEELAEATDAVRRFLEGHIRGHRADAARKAYEDAERAADEVRDSFDVGTYSRSAAEKIAVMIRARATEATR